MGSNKTRSRLMFALGVAILVGAFLLLVLNADGGVSAVGPPPPSQGETSTAPGPSDATLTDRLRQETGDRVRISYHAETGKVRFIGADLEHPIPQPFDLAAEATPEDAARQFLVTYGQLFGLTDQAQELTVMRTRAVDRGRAFVRFQQVYQGIPVFGGELIVQLNADKNVVSANGETLPDLALSIIPKLDASAAQEVARRFVARGYGLSTDDLTVSEAELWIYNPILLGGPGSRFSALVWRTEVAPLELAPINELVLVDAQLGAIALHFNQANTDKNRVIYDNQKAAYLMVDGDTFNSYTVAGIGVEKTAKIFYEVQTNLLTSGAEYNDLYDALQQACTNLIGTSGITAADCQEVQDAVDATEMNQQPTVCPATEAPVCPAGQSPTNLFFDDLEAGGGNWSVGADVGTPDWLRGNLYATSGVYHLIGFDVPTVSDHYTYMNTDVALPAGSTPYLHFNHAYAFDSFEAETYDGGVIEYSSTGGASWTDAGSLFTHNGYDGAIDTRYGNPLAGQQAFVASSNGYMSSRLDLSLLAGQNARFRFRIGTDSTAAARGWSIDDVRIYTCAAQPTPQLLQNPGFETGSLAPWQIWGSSSLTSTTSHSGSWSADMGDYNDAEDYIWQEVDIPADATDVTIDFWYQLSTDETYAEADYFCYGIWDQTVTILYVEPPCFDFGLLGDVDWAEETYSLTVEELTEVAGQTVLFSFVVLTDDSLPSRAWVDDTALYVTTPDITTPTPAPSPPPPPPPPPPATSTPTPTPTTTPDGIGHKVYLPIVLKNYDPSELLRNGNFDTGAFTPWQIVGSPELDNQMYRSAPWSARLAGRNDVDSDYVVQEVTAPSNAMEVTLGFWYRVSSDDQSSPEDFLCVEIRDSISGEVLVLGDCFDLGYVELQDQWLNFQRVFSGTELMLLKGQTVLISFQGWTNATNPSTAWVDDVSFKVTGVSP